MRIRLLSAGLVASILLVAAPMARATLLTFEDLPVGGLDIIPRPYYGLIFSNSPYDGIVDPSVPDRPEARYPGVIHGVVSGSKVLLTDPQSLAIQPWGYEQGAVFSFESGYFTSANQITMTVTATGIRNGLDPLVKTFALTTDAPTFVTFSWTDLTEIMFTGAPIGVYNDTRIVMDDLTVSTAPEPTTGTIMAGGLLCLCLLIGRQRRSYR